MMGKRAAKLLAQSETLTIRDLRAMIERSRAAGGMSSVNPAIPLEKTCEIFSAALDGRQDEEIPKAWRRDVYTGRQKPSRDALIMVNILRDCGALADKPGPAP